MAQVCEQYQSTLVFHVSRKKTFNSYKKLVKQSKGERSMKMDKVAGSGNDEFYTPEYAIAPIAKYLTPPPP